MYRRSILWAILAILVVCSLVIVGCSCSSCDCDDDHDGDGPDSGEDNFAQNPAQPSLSKSEKPTCYPSAEIADGIDNDCDGAIDEENCGDGIDNDGDKLVDESPPC